MLLILSKPAQGIRAWSVTLFLVPEVQGFLHFCTQLSLLLPRAAKVCRRAQRRGQVMVCGGRRGCRVPAGARSWRCDVRAQINSGHAREMFPAGRQMAWDDVALLLLMPHSCFHVYGGFFLKCLSITALQKSRGELFTLPKPLYALTMKAQDWRLKMRKSEHILMVFR